MPLLPLMLSQQLDPWGSKHPEGASPGPHHEQLEVGVKVDAGWDRRTGGQQPRSGAGEKRGVVLLA